MADPVDSLHRDANVRATNSDQSFLIFFDATTTRIRHTGIGSLIVIENRVDSCPFAVKVSLVVHRSLARRADQIEPSISSRLPT